MSASDRREGTRHGDSGQNQESSDDGDGSTHSILRYGPQKSVDGWVIFVTGLHEESQEDDIIDMFSEHGQVKDFKLSYNRRTGQVIGYAMIEYARQSEAQDTINNFHGKRFLGKTISVHWAFVKPSVVGESTLSDIDGR
ncbi:predicted protein [Phaeodactylum tricornutum CCAP 1055/1]|jgi:RNA-binding protein 8A|uniref:RRM domain-containing protein n=2 Tax=Phaeodactylum tricornutum TaxID=2850 RepID=B7G0T7_PHATC|nr:predicted protein [Phaeodactylum tricornutum CCAP 1055/1]EEC47946.1 predicted protein [Phaeodactylum tricornutum CCAP 1055/1]|eukprot:XP_002180538.1 predicted protein [Phaeodactylum tricornutum CCAP 1055/1]